MEIKVMSRAVAAAESNKINRPFAIISISDFHGIENIFANNENLVDTLFLYFDDIDSGDTSMSKKNAEAIKRFVLKNKNNIDLLIVHCNAGISRSPGVSAGIMKGLTNNDSEIFDNPRYCPNMRCYRLVVKEFIDSNR